MARVFVCDNREFPDPDPKVPVEEVRRQLAEFLPELVNADVREEKRGDDTVYVFTRRIGTKGTADRPPAAQAAPSATHRMPRRREGPPAGAHVAAVVRRVPEKRLRVFELAAALLDARGDLDVDAAAARAPEVALAAAEAEAYARATVLAVAALRRLPPR
jgi:PRTRC genetic system protein C